MNISLIYENTKYQNETAMLLVDAGYTVNQTYDTESQWFESLLKDKPDVLLMSVTTPSDKLMKQLYNFKTQVLCPVIVLANDADISIIEDVILAGADSCVTGKLSPERIQSLIEINLARFKVTRGRLKEIEELNQNIEFLESKLNDRKDIEKAKGVLMKSYRMNEDDAYNAMRRMAMDTGNKLGDVSRNIISMSNLLN